MYKFWLSPYQYGRSIWQQASERDINRYEALYANYYLKCVGSIFTFKVFR